MITLSAAGRTEVIPAHGHVLSLPRSSSIYHQGDQANHWYKVVSGIVRTCRFQADGHRQLTGFYYSNDVFGLDTGSYCESAEAITDVVLERFAAANAGARDRMLERALESARQSIFLLGHRTAANRLAAFLMAAAERSEAAAGVKLPMTRSDIADHLNLTLHTVSRTISEFARNGLIALDGPQNVRILNLEGLRAAAGESEGVTPPRFTASWDGLCGPTAR